MDLGLTGRSAVITGGSQGIGKATAIELAREGANVLICSRSEDVLNAAESEIKQVASGEVVSMRADVTAPEDIASVIAHAEKSFGGLDILINNAGQSAAKPFEDVDDELWDYDLDLKLKAAIRCSRLAVPALRKSAHGRIINVTAVAGKAPRAGSLPTSVSRAAGIALTKAMSLDLAKYGILVNTICIGLIKSGQIDRATQSAFPDLDLAEAYAERG